MKTSLNQLTRLAILSAFSLAFVGCAQNLEGRYAGTETVSQGQQGFGNSGQPFPFAVKIDEASGSIHGIWESSALTNPSDPNSRAVVASGQLTGNRSGERITDVRLTMYANNGGFNNGVNTGAYGVGAIAAGCSFYVGELTLSDGSLYGTLTAGGSGVDANGQPISGGCIGTRLIQASREGE